MSQNILTPFAIVIAGGLIAFAIVLTNRSDPLGSGILGTGTQPPETGAQENIQQLAPPENQFPEEPTGPVTVSVADGPVMGDPNAPVTILEFGDYECPFCKRYFEETYPLIEENFINAGLVKVVMRDYPLPFHDPLATTQAMAARCAREQGDDETYYAFRGEIYSRTESGGQGMTVDEVYAIAPDIGLNETELTDCVESDRYRDAVEADVAEGSAYGVSGTPSFFIGISPASGEGEFEGEILVGAQPYSTFEQIINSLLE